MAEMDGPKRPAEEAVDRLLDQGFLEELMDRVDEGGVQLTGEGGLPRIFRTVELCYFMLRAARLGIRCGPHAGSGSLMLSGVAADYRRFLYSGQYLVWLCSGSDRRCGAPARF